MKLSPMEKRGMLIQISVNLYHERLKSAPSVSTAINRAIAEECIEFTDGYLNALDNRLEKDELVMMDEVMLNMIDKREMEKLKAA